MIMNNYESFFDWWAFWISWLVKYQLGSWVASRQFARRTIKLLKSNFLNFRQVHRFDGGYDLFQDRFCSIYQNEMVLAQWLPALKITKYLYLFCLGICSGCPILDFTSSTVFAHQGVPLPSCHSTNCPPGSFLHVGSNVGYFQGSESHLCLAGTRGCGADEYWHFSVPFNGWQTCWLGEIYWHHLTWPDMRNLGQGRHHTSNSRYLVSCSDMVLALHNNLACGHFQHHSPSSYSPSSYSPSNLLLPSLISEPRVSLIFFSWRVHAPAELGSEIYLP